MTDAPRSVCRRPTYPLGSETPQRPSDPIGIQSMHFSLHLPGWSLLCLGHVIGCCLCRCLCPALCSPEQERSIFYLSGYRGDQHLSGGLSVLPDRDKRDRTKDFHSVRQAAGGTWSLCVCDVKNSTALYILYIGYIYFLCVFLQTVY